MISNIRTDY